MFEEPINTALQKHIPDAKVASTPDPKMGDYCYPCFDIAKKNKKNPARVAKDLAAKLAKPDIVARIETQGPYINFYLDTNGLARTVIERIQTEQEHYGSNHTGKGQHALIEHTSINPNASPHVGRARNALIGDSIARLLRFEGYTTQTHYFVNDVGKQIAMLVYACADKETVGFDELLNIYIDINERAKTDENIEKNVFALLHKFEQGDATIRKRFRDIVDICVIGQTRILGELGIHYDQFDYESDYIISNRVDAVLKELEKTGNVFIDENNRKVLNQERHSIPVENPVFVLTRADGTSLYGLRDIAYNLDKNQWAQGKNIVVLGEDQKTYMRQIKAALQDLHQPAPEAIHYSFITLKEGKMSTRKGNVVLLEEFMNTAITKAKESMQREFCEKRTDELAKTIAYGAVKFAILKVSNERQVTFDWQNALSFEGDTAAYCQYAHARIHSIFRKAGVHAPALAQTDTFAHETEHRLTRQLGEFPRTVARALETKNPSLLAHYSLHVSKCFSEFYHHCPVLGNPQQNARLSLLHATSIVLKNSLFLLGINAPTEM